MTSYLGNKQSLTGKILDVIARNTHNVHTILDLFCGTGSVSIALKSHGFSVKANDALYFNYVEAKKAMEFNGQVSNQLRDRIVYLNSDSIMANPPCSIEEAFIYQNYSLHDECHRMYYTPANALRIDYIRKAIELWRENSEITEMEYFYLLSLLLDVASSRANTTGTFQAYLKEYKASAIKPLKLEVPLPTLWDNGLLEEEKPKCSAYNQDVFDFAADHSADLAYLDPPYNNRQYISCYHLLETIARYDYPLIDDGITGLRIDPTKASVFCSKQKAPEALFWLFNKIDAQYILLSYSDEPSNCMKIADLKELLCAVGKPDTFKLVQIPYKRFQNKFTDPKSTVNELLLFIEK